MEIITLDHVTFRLKVYQDFSWLKKYGTAFHVIDETGSGCLCLGMQNSTNKYFLKIAGVNTIEADVTPEESVIILRNSVQTYHDLRHPNLTKIVEHGVYHNFYVIVFEWVDGECLFDHWNFEKYSNIPSLKSPAVQFKELPLEKRLNCIDILFSFMINVSSNNYVAIDFYDGSIMYDFDNDRTTICDIDFFRKKPAVNDVGEDFFGTKRLKAPEEYILNEVIDERTNVYTLGALLFDFFGNFSKSDITKRYEYNSFFPCSLEQWELNESCYTALLKATNLERNHRFQTISAFYNVWCQALL